MSEAAIRVLDDAWAISGPLVFAGSFAPPGDKSIAHRAFLLAGLSQGRCTLRNVPSAEDVQRTRRALEQLGVSTRDGDGACVVDGVGLRGLRPAGGALDCGNSGTTMRLLLGVLAQQAFVSELRGDASLSRRPMRRVASPLRDMGAAIVCEGDDERPPVRVGPVPEEGLRGTTHRLEVDSAQVRSAILLAGLGARGPTTVQPASAARDHTERMLRALGVDVHADDDGTTIRPKPEGWSAFHATVPGDVSGLAFFSGRAAAAPASLVARNVGLNPSRIRYLEILRDAGAEVDFDVEHHELGEPYGRVRLRGTPRRRVHVSGEDTVRCIDEVPALVVAAAAAGVEARIEDARELRVKESDRLSTLAELLRAFGARVEESRDALRLAPGAQLQPATVDAHGDHRIAMAAAVLASAVAGESVVRGVACVRTSYPSFAGDFARLAHSV